MSAQTTTLHPVASNDCGVDGKQPFLVKGDNYTMPDETGGSMTARTCNFGGSVIYAFDRLDIQADYQLEVVYLADSERRARVLGRGKGCSSEWGGGATDLSRWKRGAGSCRS